MFCCECKHWAKNEEDEAIGLCPVLNDLFGPRYYGEPEKRDLLWDNDVTLGELYTRSVFGCIRWEEK